MTFNFDQPIERRNTDSIKWSMYPNDVLPMWVADMDFRAPQAVIDALHERVDQGVFGYASHPARYSEAIVNWCDKQYGWKIQPNEIIFLSGLVSGLNFVTRTLGHIGESAITLTPVYPPFFSCLTDQGMSTISVPLATLIEGQTIRYTIDFDAFEQAITPRTTMALFCHPHNPTGREFTREENQRLGEICAKHNLLVVSDEIHCDLMLDQRKHTPMAMLSEELAERTITLMAPSKTFNLPGLGASFAIIKNEKMRKKLNDARFGIVPHTNILGLTAMTSAFERGGEWLCALNDYLTANRDFVNVFVSQYFPDVNFTVPEATYLSWLDFRQTAIKKPYTHFLEKAKVALSNGVPFGAGGDGFVRLNFGCPRATLVEVLEKMRGAMNHS
jgi:cystathionine beta-lyase